jgi:hypothetical protein
MTREAGERLAIILFTPHMNQRFIAHDYHLGHHMHHHLIPATLPQLCDTALAGALHVVSSTSHGLSHSIPPISLRFS